MSLPYFLLGALQAAETAPDSGTSAGNEGGTSGGFDWQTWLTEKGTDLAINLAVALAIFIIGMWVAKAIRGILRRILSKRVDSTLTGFLCSLSYMILMTLVVIAAIGRLGVDTTSFAAIIAAAGLAIGFAMQDSLGNFASGVMLIFFRPFKEGDFVEIAGEAGIILEIQIFCTVMKTGDNKRITIPNGAIMGGNITNYSAHDTRRVDMVFGIGYDDDLKKAKGILEDILAKDDRILKEPAPVIALSELADSSVNFVVRPWVNTADYWAVWFDTHENVKLEFDAQGISIPYPQTDVHLHKVGA